MFVCMWICMYVDMYMWIIMYLDMYVCLFNCNRTLFNPKLWNFCLTFLMWLSRFSVPFFRFSCFLGCCFLFCFFDLFYTSLRFFCKFEEEKQEWFFCFFMHINKQVEDKNSYDTFFLKRFFIMPVCLSNCLTI